jgi:hypothetical protein
MMKAFVITVLVVSILRFLFYGLAFLVGLNEREDQLVGKGILYGGISTLWIIGAIIALCVG